VLSSSEQLDEHAKKQLAKYRELREYELNSPSQIYCKPDPLSSIIFFLLRKKDLQTLLPDYELYSCKQQFSSLSCHESYFGLARLLSLEGKFSQAIEVLESAIELYDDLVYKIWYNVLTAIVTDKQKSDKDNNTVSIFNKFLCCHSSRKPNILIEELDALPDGIEKWWCYMELSFKGLADLETPQYFAAKIKEIDSYYGYLAWNEVLFKRNELDNGLNILKELIRNHGNRPEAYIKLWTHYYYTQKNYEKAEDTVSEAILKVTSHEYHHFYILISLFLAKTQFKLKKTRECLDFLKRKFIENPTYPVYLYHYGRLSTKSKEFVFNGSAIGALYECINLCDTSRYGVIYYWLAKAYILGRQYQEAFDTIKLALKHLDPVCTRKITDLKNWIAEIQPSIHKIQRMECILAKQSEEIDYKEFKLLYNEIAEKHRLTSDILHAKMLWKLGKKEESLNKLYLVSGVSMVKMTAYFLLIKYLEAQNNFKCMKTVAYEMVSKCKNPQVPSHIWVKVNLLYADVLIKNSKPHKAILVLKCLAKVLPPIPFVDIKYTKLLQRSKDIQDLTKAHTQILESMNAYVYSTYKNSFVSSNYNPRDFSNKIISEEAAPVPELSEIKSTPRKHNRNNTTNQCVNRSQQKKKTAEFIQNKQEKDLKILGVTIPNLLEFRGFSICSDSSFLYKIAKISIKFNICLQDGLCAIKDFIELIKFEKDSLVREKRKKKSVKIQKILIEKIKNEGINS
jgi:tetratricopeptide (TPR) repeat protein